MLFSLHLLANYYHLDARLLKGLEVEEEFKEPPALALLAAFVARAAAAWAWLAAAIAFSTFSFFFLDEVFLVPVLDAARLLFWYRESCYPQHIEEGWVKSSSFLFISYFLSLSLSLFCKDVTRAYWGHRIKARDTLPARTDPIRMPS